MPIRLPAAPPGFDRDRFFDGVNWFQTWQVFDGVFTPGHNDVAALCDRLGLPADLTGTRVLDIGAWNGCLSFECERRGAREVLALGPERPSHSGFYRLRDAVGSTRVRYRLGTVYDLDPEQIGTFDLVLFCGVLYHLRYPLLGIDNLRRVCTGAVYVETHVSDYELGLAGFTSWKSWLARWFRRKFRDLPMWRFYRSGELNWDDSNWFGPNVRAVLDAFGSAGFDARLIHHAEDRATFHAHVQPGVPEFLSIASGERMFYDVLVGRLLGAPAFPSAGLLERRIIALLASSSGLGHCGDAAGWVAGVYHDLLGRAPGAAEIGHALEQLGDGDEGERRAYLGDLLASPEYHKHLMMVCYEKLLCRPAQGHELVHWIRTLHVKARTTEQVIGEFVASDEYFRATGGTAATWLAFVYRDLIGCATPGETSQELAALEAGTLTRRAVADRLTGRAEFPRTFLNWLRSKRSAEAA